MSKRVCVCVRKTFLNGFKALKNILQNRIRTLEWVYSEPKGTEKTQRLSLNGNDFGSDRFERRRRVDHAVYGLCELTVTNNNNASVVCLL